MRFRPPPSPLLCVRACVCIRCRALVLAGLERILVAQVCSPRVLVVALVAEVVAIVLRPVAASLWVLWVPTSDALVARWANVERGGLASSFAVLAFAFSFVAVALLVCVFASLWVSVSLSLCLSVVLVEVWL